MKVGAIDRGPRHKSDARIGSETVLQTLQEGDNPHAAVTFDLHVRADVAIFEVVPARALRALNQ